MSHAIVNALNSDFEKSITLLKNELNKIRTGRANPAILDEIKVNYYGTLMPLKGLASFSAPDPTLITIQPFDINAISEIEKAILQADLGINPSNDGKVIRLPIPPLSEERRKDLVKIIKKFGEETKISLRQHRRDANEAVKDTEKKKELSEDDAKRLKDEIQKLTDKSTEKIDELLQRKEAELLKI